MNTPHRTDPVGVSKSIRLLRQMNHDLRNPLNALIATASMLNEGIYDPLTPGQARAVDRIERNARRMVALLDDLIIYVKADAGEYSLAIRNFDPHQLIEDIREQCRATATAKNIVLQATVDETIPASLRGDEGAIQRIILALVWNAISFTSTGTVEIKSEWAADGWHITVVDTGPGIPVNARIHLFEAFWRGDVPGSPVPTSGFGLGLAKARALAKVMAGSITLKASGEGGSTFCLRLPLTS